MIFKQYYLNCLAHASYLVGDEQTGEAAIVDPQRDVDQYIEECRERNLEIRYVFLTHCHADFVAGHLELRDRTGAGIYLGAKAEAEYAFTPMADGEALEFGQVRFQALETPGHTVESICLLIYDLERDAEKPHAVLTGDTLFIGDVGRPDLQASVGYAPNDLAGMQYDSLREKLLRLPDETLVYPAHGAGSLCGRKMSKETVSTIGEQRRSNYALQLMSRDEFVALVTADLPESPAYFSHDAAMNTKEHATLDKTVAAALQPLTVDEVLAFSKDGAQLVDTRDGGDFGRAHFAGSLNIGLGGQYATWAGTLLDRVKPIILITEPGSEREAAMRLGRIGFDHVAGYLEGGVEALEHRRELAEGWDRVGPQELAEYLESDGKTFVLDVRNPGEFQAKRIAGAMNIPLNKLRARLAEVPRDRRLVVHCAGGYRSSIAASILQQAGLAEVEELSGGIAAWEAVGMPVAAARV